MPDGLDEFDWAVFGGAYGPGDKGAVALLVEMDAAGAALSERAAPSSS
jgi:hypothetical protein